MIVTSFTKSICVLTCLQEIPPASMMALDGHHHHLGMLPNGLHIQTSMAPGAMGGMSTYLIDESAASNLPPPPMQYPNATLRYSSLGMRPLFVLFLSLCLRSPTLPDCFHFVPN